MDVGEAAMSFGDVFADRLEPDFFLEPDGALRFIVAEGRGSTPFKSAAENETPHDHRNTKRVCGSSYLVPAVQSVVLGRMPVNNTTDVGAPIPVVHFE